MKSSVWILGLCLAFTMVSCSTAVVRVMPGEKTNKVVVRDIERETAESEAVKAATKFCSDRQRETIFVTDKSNYSGSMDESTRSAIRKGSQAAMILGGVGALPDQTRSVGAILGTAGTVGYVMTSGKDYEAVVEFKCK